MRMKTALTIAGSDSGGGAGIQADIKAMTANGVFATSAITALTAQNTLGVQGIYEVSPDFLTRQLDSVFSDLRPDAVKIGMVSSAGLIEAIADSLEKYRAENIVADPVMVSTSGARLISEDAVETLKRRLLPLAVLITPNIPEAEVLSGLSVKTAEDMEKAAALLGEKFGCAVLCKGGHRINDANDLLYRDGKSRWFRGERINNPNTHGTGCTLSSAIAANLAKGFSLDEAVERAKDYLSGALAAMLDLGAGSGPMNHAFALTGRFAQSGDKPVTARLLSSARDCWDSYRRHPFVRGLADGSLDRKKFQFYMVQDYLYLLEYARVFALGAAKACDEETMRCFASYVHQILDGEMDIHRAYLTRLGISPDQAGSAAPASENLAYTSYMLRIAYAEGPAEIAAAILACALSYEHIARKIAEEKPEAAAHPFYGEWVSGYACEEYAAENRRLISLLEKLASDYTEPQLRHLEEIFKNCSRCEADFWDMAWKQGS